MMAASKVHDTLQLMFCIFGCNSCHRKVATIFLLLVTKSGTNYYVSYGKKNAKKITYF